MKVQFKIIFLAVYIIVIISALKYLPSIVYLSNEAQVIAFNFTFLSLWRYGWWFVHFIRSMIYANIVFPARRRRAEQLWDSGWRPKRLFFMMTTYNELKDTTEKVLQSIIDECITINVLVKVFIGITIVDDEKIIRNFFAEKNYSFPFELILVRQPLPGKRFAITATLRVIIKHQLKEDDLVVFMDGDTYLNHDCLRKCISFFPLFPKLQALTTHEDVITLNAPRWFTKWLILRFAQRDFIMQSYSLSNKILTLTGRMSIFRGKHLLEPAFIDILENDHLTHWLWGKFRFLSGDDKSTWYYLLKSEAEMFYVPDATTTTIEYIAGNPFHRMKDNLQRWSGNNLRNGSRAIALGPKRIGFFIWWCLIDQRLAIWTMPVGFIIALVISFTSMPTFFIFYITWIAFSRLIISIVLFFYTKQIDMSFPLLLYINQIANSLIKIYIIFRLPKQKWANRGVQNAGSDNVQTRTRNYIANYLTILYCTIFMLLIFLYLDLISFPTIADLNTFN